MRNIRNVTEPETAAQVARHFGVSRATAHRVVNAVEDVG